MASTTKVNPGSLEVGNETGSRRVWLAETEVPGIVHLMATGAGLPETTIMQVQTSNSEGRLIGHLVECSPDVCLTDEKGLIRAQ